MGGGAPTTGKPERPPDLDDTARRWPSETILIGAGDLLVVLGSFLPWVISGTARRDSYATVRAAKNIAVVGSGLGETALSIWFLVPLLAAVVLLAVVFDRRSLGSAIAIALGALSLVVAGWVMLAPVERGVGPAVTLLGSAGLLVGSALLLRRSTRRP